MPSRKAVLAVRYAAAGNRPREKSSGSASVSVDGMMPGMRAARVSTVGTRPCAQPDSTSSSTSAVRVADARRGEEARHGVRVTTDGTVVTDIVYRFTPPA